MTSTLDDFWRDRRDERPELPTALPEAWTFGATPAQADDLLDLVLRGVKDGTASSFWDYEASGDRVPEVGDIGIVTDSTGAPRAVVETTSVRIVPFDEVDADHARAEGEGDRTLAHWRRVHEAYWRAHSEDPRGFDPRMPVVCERFRLVWPAPATTPPAPATTPPAPATTPPAPATTPPAPPITPAPDPTAVA